MLQLLLILLAFVVVGFKIHAELFKDFVGWRNKQPRLVKSAHDYEVDAYLKQIAFYKELNATDQQLFLERVQYISETKAFQGMEGLTITDEIRSIVAASAVQVAFRLENWKFPSYHTFRVYPECFYSGIFRKFLKGGAGYQGHIWFSLRDFREGYANPTNGINLGLHEMAHALIIEMENGNMDHEFTSAFEAIEKLSLDRMPKIRSGQLKFLREYAGTNTMEFIAVCTEHFFERPDEFRNSDRELYDAFMWLYKQEPHTPPSILQVTNLPRQEKPERNYRFARWHWSLTLALLGIFISPGLLIWQLHNVALDKGSIFYICITVIALSAFFLYRPIVRSSALGKTQFILCHLFGLGPFVLSVFFLLNNNIPVWNSAEAHAVDTWYKTGSGDVYVNARDNVYARESDYRMVDQNQSNRLRNGAVLIIVHQYGPFGIPVHGHNLVVSPGPDEGE